MTQVQTRRQEPWAWLPWLLAMGIALWPSVASAKLRLEPSTIRIGTFFNGAKIRIIGEVPQGSQVVVEVLGKRAEELLLRRGRQWHIWMTVGELDVENAPTTYYALSTHKSAFDKQRGPTAFGLKKLLRHITFVGDRKGRTHAELAKEFIQLKQSEGLYGQFPGALKVTGSEKGRSTVQGSFRLPSRIDSGTYRVRLFVVDKGRMVHTDVKTFRVRTVGLPAFLENLAKNHGSLYGLLAVFIAVLFGFGVGLVFKKSGKRGHGPPPEPER